MNQIKVTMQQQKLAALFGFMAGIAQAAPSPAAAATTGFSSECSDITLNTNWLVANCPNDAGTSVSSGVYLPSHVTNTEGKLKVCGLVLPTMMTYKSHKVLMISCSCLLVENGVCSDRFDNI